MSDDSHGDVPATKRMTAADLELIRRARARSAASLVLYHRDGATNVSLAVGRPVVVGRAEPSDVAILDESLSRQHARFELVAGQVWVEDLGSTNGTHLNGERVARAPVSRGDVVALGAITAAVFRPMATDEHGVLSHEHFQAVLEYEVQRARGFAGRLAVMMVRGEGAPALSEWSPKLRAALRPVDQVALYGPQTVEVLLPEASEETALATARKVAQIGGGLRCGLALYPALAASAAELIEVSRDALRSATAGDPVRLAPDRSRPAGTPDAGAPVVRCAAMREVYDTVERVARSGIPVLIVGETGTGKELVADAIHRGSRRADKPLCCLNCGAIPAQLVESALFGHERGAFTGASQQHRGVFESADGGTVFLDEIGELAPDAQVALLRVLETGRLTRVGGTREISVDVRIVAATHRELEAMVADGAFREDLLYRLNAMVVRLPPLRERTEEIEALALHFLDLANRSAERQLVGFDAAALRALQRHGWPGNVRELRNAVERAVVISRGETVTLDDLPERIRALGRAGSGRVAPAPDTAAPADLLDADTDFRTRVQRFEAGLIEQALVACDHNQSETSRRLRIPLRTLINKIQQYDIRRR